MYKSIFACLFLICIPLNCMQDRSNIGTVVGLIVVAATSFMYGYSIGKEDVEMEKKEINPKIVHYNDDSQ